MAVADLTEREVGWGRRIGLSLLVITAFLLADEGRPWLYRLLDIRYDGTDLAQRFFYFHVWYLLAALIVAFVAVGPRRMFGALGLTGNIFTGLLVGGLCTAVMGAGYFAFGEWSPPAPFLPEYVRGAVFPGFFEEVFYRGMLFGILFRFAGWGFIPASLLGAIFFGAAHLYQGDGLSEALAVAGFTAVGAVWFAWLYAEWDNNLWVPITFHILMNGYWALFSISDTALGGGVANIFRFGTIGGSILLTIIMMNRRDTGSRIKGRLLIS